MYLKKREFHVKLKEKLKIRLKIDGNMNFSRNIDLIHF